MPAVNATTPFPPCLITVIRPSDGCLCTNNDALEDHLKWM